MTKFFGSFSSGVTSTAEAEAQYYSNNGVVNIPGITVVPGNPDPNFPNALPILGFIQSAYTNQDEQIVQGIDFGATSADGAVTLEAVYCLGNCGCGPAVLVDPDELHANVTPARFDALLAQWRAEQP